MPEPIEPTRVVTRLDRAEVLATSWVETTTEWDLTALPTGLRLRFILLATDLIAWSARHGVDLEPTVPTELPPDAFTISDVPADHRSGVTLLDGTEVES